MPGNIAPPGALGEGPGGQDDEGRLDEFRRLDAEDPALGPLDLVAEEQGGDDEGHADDEDQKGRAPDITRRQERGRQQERDRRQQEQHLMVHEIEGRKAQALGDRGAARHAEHDAEDDQQKERGEKPAIDGPPPIGETERLAREIIATSS